MWNVGSGMKPGVDWKGLDGNSQAKLMGQWTCWPCRWCEEGHSGQEAQTVQMSSGATVEGHSVLWGWRNVNEREDKKGSNGVDFAYKPGLWFLCSMG